MFSSKKEVTENAEKIKEQPFITPLETQTLDLDPIREYTQTIKEPSLFTILKVNGNGIKEDIIITALDIVLIVGSLLDEIIKKQKEQKSHVEQGNNQNKPYNLYSPIEWLLAAKEHEISQDKEEFKHFTIGGQNIRISTLDRYSSSEDNRPDDFYEFMHNAINQYVINLSHPSAVNLLRQAIMKPGSNTGIDLGSLFILIFHLIQSMEAKYITSGYYLYLISEDDSTKKLTPLETPCLIYSGENTPFQLVVKDKNDTIIKVNFKEERDRAIVEAFHKLILGPCKEKRDKIFLSSFSEIIRYIALKRGYQLHSSGEEWHRPPYKGKLAEDEKAAQTYTQTKIPELNSTNLAKAVCALDEEIDDSFFTNLPDFSGIASHLIDYLGTALSVDNEEKDKIKRGVKEITTTVSRTFTALSEDKAKRKTSRVVFEALLNQAKDHSSTEHGQKIANFNLDFIVKMILRQLEAGALDKSGLEVIRILSNIFTVLEIRAILSNKITKPNKHLPVTVASLFFSETSRSLRQEGLGCMAVFPAALALLDLIQTQQPCPDCNETYSPLNLLKTPEQRTKLIDVYGKVYSKNDERKLRDELRPKPGYV